MRSQFAIAMSNLFYSQTLERISPSIDVVGRIKHVALDEPTAQALCEMSGCVNFSHPGLSAITYPKVISKGSLVMYSRSGSRSHKRNSFTVTFVDPQQPQKVFFGCIERFISIPAEAVHVALISPLCATPSEVLRIFPSETLHAQEVVIADYVFPSCRRQTKLVAVPISIITLKCFDVSNSNLSVLSMIVKDIDSK